MNCASWSPNDPQSLIACGGYDKKLTIIDTRISPNEQSSIVWSVENAHDRPIRDCKFNPYIPYWLASAGEDSMVNIWDIRATYHAPVAKIDGLMNMAISVIHIYIHLSILNFKFIISLITVGDLVYYAT